MESLFKTKSPAPLLIGGLPSESSQTVRYAIEIPRLLSFLAHGDFSAEVTGLDAFSNESWPPVAVTHLAFDLMVGLGTLMAGVGVVSLSVLWRKKSVLLHRKFLTLL